MRLPCACVMLSRCSVSYPILERTARAIQSRYAGQDSNFMELPFSILGRSSAGILRPDVDTRGPRRPTSTAQSHLLAIVQCGVGGRGTVRGFCFVLTMGGLPLWGQYTHSHSMCIKRPAPRATGSLELLSTILTFGRHPVCPIVPSLLFRLTAGSLVVRDHFLVFLTDTV